MTELTPSGIAEDARFLHQLRVGAIVALLVVGLFLVGFSNSLGISQVADSHGSWNPIGHAMQRTLFVAWVRCSSFLAWLSGWF